MGDGQWITWPETKACLLIPLLSISTQLSITFGDNTRGKVIGLAKITILKDNHIDNMMLVQYLGYNLMSVSKLTDIDLIVLFSKTGCEVFMATNYALCLRKC